MTAITRDVSLTLGRELRPLARDPFSVIFTMVQPLVFLGLFGPLLGSFTGQGTADALQWFVPGIVVMSALFGASTTGSNLQQDLISGAFDRLLVTPLGRPALLIGRSLREVVPTVLQAAIIVLVVVPFGFDVSPAGALLGLAIVATFAVGLGSLSNSLALAVRDQEWVFWAVQQTLLFPLLLLSGMLLPVHDGPGWMQALAKANPLTHIVDAERLLFAGDVASWTVAWGALSAVAVLVVGLVVGVRSVQRGYA